MAGDDLLTRTQGDARLVEMWLHGKSVHTQRAYRRDVGLLLGLGVGLGELSLGDVQGFVDGLTGSAHTRRRRLAAVKSLLSFGVQVGYLAGNVAARVRAPGVRGNLAERILTIEEALLLVNAGEGERDRLLLRVLYGSGLRVSEMCGLRWRDVRASGEAGVITVFGKNGKTRSILLNRATWCALWAARPLAAGADAPVFVSQRRGALSATQAWRVVRNAGRKIGRAGVSPHWLRHSHASHALARGASVALVRDTLGHASIATTSGYLHALPGESSALYLPF